MWCVSVAWVESDIFHLHTCIQTYLNTCTSLLGSGLRSWSHVAFYASGFNLQSLGLPQCQTEEGKWPRASCFLEPISSTLPPFVSLSLSPIPPIFSSSCFLFFLPLLASSPTHTFRNVRGQNNNSCQMPVYIMIYSHFLVKFDFCRAFANTLFR